MWSLAVQLLFFSSTHIFGWDFWGRGVGSERWQHFAIFHLSWCWCWCSQPCPVVFSMELGRSDCSAWGGQGCCPQPSSGMQILHNGHKVFESNPLVSELTNISFRGTQRMRSHCQRGAGGDSIWCKGIYNYGLLVLASKKSILTHGQCWPAEYIISLQSCALKAVHWLLMML